MNNKTSKILFGLYLALLVWLILFKLALSPEEIPHLRGINLIPFYYDTPSDAQFSEVFFNILVFLPLGAYTARFHPGRRLHCLWIFPVVSLTFEALQYIFSIGASDITDLLTNTAGGLLGFLLFRLLEKTGKKRAAKILDLCILFTILSASALGLLLFLSNR